MHQNLSFEFHIEPYPTNAGMKYILSQTKRTYLILDTNNIKSNMHYEEHYFSTYDKKTQLEISEASSPDKFVLYGPDSIRKKIFILSKNKKTLALLEIHSPAGSADFYCIQLFIKISFSIFPQSY